ncbi:hypothetical protein A1O3_02206 [Capronia epimyces CBS 606.96]|uniref:Uncharacterized protein n=1 Tax=Capronia epimyces CBS 606.96 TaxID=1182542 RepID=W9Y8G5_9EURO|nr:uncharacterized protein A1O3_02206 [Capronia epimyces CBS 606.96]EXJ89142.1 hypothetical protein A1O3_02206 [Capronia epimyces CBS 606.96]
MFFQSTLAAALAALAVLSPAASAQPLESRKTDTGVTTFKSPSVKPFLHLNIIADLPSNASTLYGITARAPNMGGNFTGAIEGKILPLGAAIETIPTGTNGTTSFYTNTWSLNTTSGTGILLDATATIHYANNALHGFGSMSFRTDDKNLIELNYGSYVAEFEGNFNTGEAVVDVFDLASNGRRDGQKVLALLPPGGGSA